ncbi:MAG: hypothetical protein ACFFDR_01435, partial [Candidatus Thorarchaeota archaeon]
NPWGYLRSGDPMSGNDDYDGATAGRVLIFDDSESVSFPKSFKEAMGTNRGLMVLVHKDRLIKIFPLDNDDVVYLSLEISKLTNDFLTKLSQIFKKCGLVDLLFSTGVCLRGTRCFYECYFNPSQLNTPVDELSSSLSSLDGVKKVIVEKVIT